MIDFSTGHNDDFTFPSGPLDFDADLLSIFFAPKVIWGNSSSERDVISIVFINQLREF